MREAAFVKRNQERWQQFEQVLASRNASPDKVAEIFIQITDDLSFAQTQYPNSRVNTYLNNIGSKIHLEIYKNKREDKSRFITFWKYELPQLLFQHRKQLLYALLTFVIAALLGAVSAHYDETFVRLIMGDAYVNMTLENIENGNPLAVYGKTGETDMFFAITFNNVRVSFFAFAAGLLFSIGSGYLLFSNGVMVGAFLSMFSQKGLLLDSVMIIMLHGTIELSSIVIAGAAGFVLGNSYLFPGTFSRLASFKQGALNGMKIVIGIIPLFILAGFIESFITRYTFMPVLFKGIIIFLSAFLIIYYFVYYPYKLYRNGNVQSN